MVAKILWKMMGKTVSQGLIQVRETNLMIQSEILKILASVGVKISADQLEKPPHPDFGELSFPCFTLAKVYKKNPLDIAKDIVAKAKIPKSSLVSKMEARGGYVNFHFNYARFSEIVLYSLEKKRKSIGGKRVMIEYSSPNPVHPMHIGSSRGTFIGDALANVFEYVGHKVIRTNYINNVGLQVAKLVAAYLMWADGNSPEGKPDLWLWKYYVRFHEEEKSDPSLIDKAKDILRKYELEGDREVRKVWDKVVGWCVDGFKETYARTGIEFDNYFYEIEFREPGKKIVQQAVKRGFAINTEDGAVFANLEPYGLPGTIIQRSDGTGLYITSDLGLTDYKFRKFKLDSSFWVAGAPQELHFRQLFKILDLAGHKYASMCVHVPYEVVSLAEGKMSSREGRAVMLDEVLDRMSNLAHAEVGKRNPEMSEAKRRKIAGQIALGALKYAVLKIDPKNQITFNWDQMLSLDGNTGPYLQYAHTRCLGILSKVEKQFTFKPFDNPDEYEKALIRKLSEFNEVVEAAVRECKVNGLCNYGYELATIFNSFYHNCKVLGLEDKKRMAYRLALVKATKETLEKIFSILGMEAPEKM
jgi:arginyl-tRNA synthetase